MQNLVAGVNELVGDGSNIVSGENTGGVRGANASDASESVVVAGANVPGVGGANEPGCEGNNIFKKGNK